MNREKEKEKSERKGSVLKQLLQVVEKQFGKGTLICMGEKNTSEEVGAKVISTGSLGLDMATGIMGYPRGRLIEIFGPESCGKTTMALHAIAEAQAGGGIAAFIDAEHAFDTAYAASLGVDIGNLLISQPDYGEQALEIAEILVRSGVVDIIVIDSVAALVPKAEIEGEMGDRHMGLQARLMSQAMRKLTAITHKQSACLIFINQIRQKIGVTFGSPETTTGGMALKFYASMRLEVKRVGAIKNGDLTIGSRTKVKLVKNKMAPPFREAEFDILFGRGIDSAAEIFDLAVEAGIIEKGGSWYILDGERLGPGRERGVEHLRQNPQVTSTLRQRLIAARHVSWGSADKYLQEVAATPPVMEACEPAIA